MANVRVTFHGNEARARIQAGTIKGIQDGTEFLLQEANRECPLDEGTLQRSGNTDIDPSNLKGSVYYDTPYAIRLHEHPEYHFQGGRKGKWLERATTKNMASIRSYIAKKIKEELRGG